MGPRVVLSVALLVGCVSSPPVRASTDNVRQLELKDEVSALSVMPLMFGLQAAIENHEKLVHIDIDSPGGYVSAGMRVLYAMRLAKEAGITIECRIVDDGMAASMAAIIFEVGCNSRQMAPSASLMFHEPAMGFEGGKEGDFQRAANDLADLNKRMAIQIAARLRHEDGTRWTAAEYVAWIKDRNRWVDATEAVAMGAADSVG